MDLQDLIDEVDRPARVGPQTWYDTLEGKAKELVDELLARARETGQPPSYAGLARVLKTHFGIRVNPSTIRANFNRMME